ncbi:MAG TPA: hypothetical protein VK463_03820 [Desulfomonilaceae bacterium]|nr:hypothetical protein [Desulfomonilaceae bacterium]
MFHIVYRGLTAIACDQYKLILAVYVFAGTFIALQDRISALVARAHSAFAAILPFMFVGFVVLATYVPARYVGGRAAAEDMYERTCSLPKILSITDAKGQDVSHGYAGARLLGTDGPYVVLFRPLTKDDTNTVPIIIRLGKEEAHVIKTFAE